MESAKQKQKSGLAIAGLVLGIIGIVFSFIPIVNNISLILGALAIIFAIIAFVQKSDKGKTVAALVLGIIAVAVTLVMQATTVKVINDAADKLNDSIDAATGAKTSEILGRDVEVTLGDFTVEEGTYYSSTKLPVTVKNLLSESKSFTIHIEAADANGNRIDDAYVYANSLSAGQSQNFEAFTYISNDKLNQMKAATFNIIEVSEM